jgi:signal transduction histidine kinase/DNA-binding response OmpR family regulator
VDYRAIWTSVVVFSLILAVAVLWIRQLSRQRLALVAARADAEAANRAKDEFLANMSHELRTPLHAILGYAELVRGGALNETSRKEALATIAHSGRHLLSLINDLLDLSRIKSGHLELNPAPVQLPALVEEIAAMVRVEAQSKGLDFFLDALANLPAIVMADGRRLRQILLNLLGNAIKFTDVGGVTLTVSARVLDDQRAELRFSVQDTGVGIPTPDRSRIFAPFEQAEEGEKRESGAGLGLAISRELANLMGGDIEVESQSGVGSVFRFWVVVPVVSEPQAIVPVHERILGYRGGRKCILVVDDQEENRLLLQGMLQPVGFDVVLAAGGPEAVEAARTRRPDLVVMDLRMPKLSGFDAAAAIRRCPGLEHVVIIAASASSADLERAESERAIFAARLRKPFLAADLLETIERLLGLTWRYATQEGAVGTAGGWTAEDGEEHVPDADLLAPPRALLEELLGLARLGMLVRVEQIALDLAQRDERYRAFGRRVYGLARSFDEERLIALLEASLRAQSDALTD